MKTQKAFGDVVRKRREKAGLSQEALASRAGLHRNHIGLIERGQRMPSIEVVRKLAVGLDMSMTALVQDLERTLTKTASRHAGEE